MNLRRTLSALSLILVLLFAFSPVAFCINENRKDILCVAYRGDTALYPENSIEAVESAFRKGADMVSVFAEKSGDNLILPLNEDSKAFYSKKYKEIPLKELLGEIKKEQTVIIDIDFSIADEVYELVLKEEKIGNVILRIQGSSKDLSEWSKSKKEKIDLIGIYKGNIIWNAVSHIENLKSVSSIVQYQSKNYFNVMYGSFLEKRFLKEGYPRVLAPAYSYDLCGQRPDNASGWNELIEKGFSVIETNNITALVSYIETCKKLDSELSSLIEKGEKLDLSLFSEVSAGNFEKALEKAKALNEKSVVSSGEKENVISQLLFSLNNLNLKTGAETQRGALNVTAGKVVAAILVGLAILAGQIYVYKMQGDKRRKK